MNHVFITGASRGIGFALAELFLSKGDRVFTVARNEGPLLSLKTKYPESFEYLVGDLTDEVLVSRLKFEYPWEKLDILYNNAGAIAVSAFDELETKDFKRCLDVNFMAPVGLIKGFASFMGKAGHIVNIGTMGAFQGSVKFGGLAAYSSSKAALANLTELLAEEWKDQDRPKINYLAIGAVQTEMLETAFPGYQAPLQADEMASYFYDFGINGKKYFNGKILPVSLSTP